MKIVFMLVFITGMNIAQGARNIHDEKYGWLLFNVGAATIAASWAHMRLMHIFLSRSPSDSQT